MVNSQSGKSYTVEDLRKIIALLRAPSGCPWDQEQTHASIRRNFLEEAYEVCEAIDLDDPALLCEELGDVLTQVLFHAQIAEEAGRFTVDDVADATCRKLVFRHPHVFGDDTVTDADQVMENWDDLKRQEKQHKTVAEAMEAVAVSLPANWRAEKIQDKARKAGLDLADASSALDKLSESVCTARRVSAEGVDVLGAVGDVLFSAVHVARILGVCPETALHQSADKFTRRFAQLEQSVQARGGILADLTLAEYAGLYRAGEDKGL